MCKRVLHLDRHIALEIAVLGAKHLRQLIGAAEDKRTVAVLVRRGDSPLFMALRLKD